MFVTISRNEVDVSRYTGAPKKYVVRGGTVMDVVPRAARLMVADGAAKYASIDEIRLARTPVRRRTPRPVAPVAPGEGAASDNQEN